MTSVKNESVKGKNNKKESPKKSYQKPKQDDNKQKNASFHNNRKSYNRTGKNRKGEVTSKKIFTTNPVISKEVLSSLRYGDPRSPYGPTAGVQNNINIEYVSHGATIVVPLSDIAITSVASSLVSKALIRGMDSIYAGAALQQISELLKNAAINAEPVVMDIPGYLQCVCAALCPKTVLHKGSAFNYAWSSNGSSITTMQQLPYGNTNNSGMILYGTIAPGNSGPLGFPLVVPGPPPTDDQKKLAFSKFTSALSEGDNGTGKPLTKKELKNIMRDTSAFVGQTIVDGFAIGGQGGTIVRLGSEGIIKNPLMGRFATVLNSYRDYNRACNENIEAGGGPMELGMFLTEFRNSDQEKIRKPVFKFVDADALMHVFFMWWIYRIDMFTKSPEYSTIISINGAEGDRAVRNRCIPCTMLEAQIVLRNEFMKVFSNTQYGVQSLGPTTDANESWLGYSCGVGTAPNFEVSSLLMSGPFCENLRALSSVSVYDVENVSLLKTLESAKKTRKLTDVEQRMWDNNRIIRPYLPVLGSYLNGGLNEADYIVSYNNGVTVPLFQPPPSSTPKKPEIVNSPNVFNNKKGSKPNAKDSPAIRLNDGSTGNGFVALNDPSIIGELTDRINKVSLYSAKYTAGLRENTAEPAANVLRQLGTNLFAVRDLDGSDSGSYLDTVKLHTKSYAYTPEKAIEEQFRFVPGLHFCSANNADCNMKAANDGETEIVTLGTDKEEVTWRTYLDASAKLGIADGVTSNIEKKIEQLDAKGRGGIFSDIANALAPSAQIALPLAGGFVDSMLSF